MTDTTDSKGISAEVGADPATARVDVQDPLPETSWLWRRIYVFTFSMISVAFILYGLQSLHEMQNAEGVYRVSRYMIGIHAMLILFYMLAPSAEQIVKLIQASRIIMSGIPTSRSAVSESPTGARTAVVATTGVPIPPEALPTAPAAAPEPDFAPRSQS
jgi:hypothetical protein